VPPNGRFEFNTVKLLAPATRDQFDINLTNHFSALLQDKYNNSITTLPFSMNAPIQKRADTLEKH
jgi:hypothetical protein